MKAPALKSYTDEMRRTLLRQIVDILRADDQLKEKQVFIGIKGRLTYGAVQTPPGALEIGSAVPESKLYDFYGRAAAPESVALAGRPPGDKDHLSTHVPARRTDASGVLGEANAGAQEPPRHAAGGVQDERPDKEQRRPDEPAPVESREETTAPTAKTANAQAVKTREEVSAAAKKRREDAEAERARRSSKREMERAERKKQSDEQAAERKKRNDEQAAERKKRSDEQLATLMLQTAESQRKARANRLYRKTLREIVDKYPETEAGKKAKDLLK